MKTSHLASEQMSLSMTKKVARAILFPPFLIIFVTSALCLVAFAAWVYFDSDDLRFPEANAARTYRRSREL
jgi:hypothetical protein